MWQFSCSLFLVQVESEDCEGLFISFLVSPQIKQRRRDNKLADGRQLRPRPRREFQAIYCYYVMSCRHWLASVLNQPKVQEEKAIKVKSDEKKKMSSAPTIELTKKGDPNQRRGDQLLHLSSPLPPLGLRHSTLFSKEKELNFFSSILVGPFSSFLLPAPYVCRLFSFVSISFLSFCASWKKRIEAKGRENQRRWHRQLTPGAFLYLCN